MGIEDAPIAGFDSQVVHLPGVSIQIEELFTRFATAERGILPAVGAKHAATGAHRRVAAVEFAFDNHEIGRFIRGPKCTATVEPMRRVDPGQLTKCRIEVDAGVD